MMLALALLLQAEAWEPADSSVFAVGILKWKDRSVARFPQKDRKDAEWIDVLAARGVPKDRIVFLKDREARLPRIRKEFSDLVGRARGTLIVYYAGHGNPDGSFMPYDGEEQWTVRSIVDEIEDRFKGSRALLLADCCYSGALAKEAERRGSRKIAVLASAPADSESTGEWAFTECLIRGFRGDAGVDANRDGRVGLDELAGHVESDMPFAVEQLAASRTAGLRLDLGPASGAAATSVEAEWEGEWWKARVLEEKDGLRKVTYVGWDSRHDEWVKPERIRAWAPPAYAAGARVLADGRAATVLEGRLGVHRVRLEDGAEEWVGPSRLRPRP